MFGFLKRDPVKKLEAEYRKLLEEARDLQRSGDIKGFADKTSQAEEVANQIEAQKKAPAERAAAAAEK